MSIFSMSFHNSSSRNSSDVDHLLDFEMIPKPPIAYTGLDDDDEPDTNAAPNTLRDQRGVDDGFFCVDIDPHDEIDEPLSRPPPDHVANDNGSSGTRPGVNNNFPYAPRIGRVDRLAGNPQITPDVNVYQHKKTLGEGMMNLALLSANANQLRYILLSHNFHPHYYISLFLILLSLILQVAVGVGLLMNSRYNVKMDQHLRKADRINNFTVLGIFLITIVNVFIPTCGMAELTKRRNF